MDGTVGSSSGCEAVDGGGFGMLSVLDVSGFGKMGLLITISGSCRS